MTAFDVSERYFERTAESQSASDCEIRTVLLDGVRAFLRRFVVMTDAQADAATLFVAHTHAIEAAEATPYLAVTSAEKRSGKSRFREVLELVVCEPLSSANISDAALFRAIEALRPTLLLDEADAIFKAREREDLRGLLNAGHRRGAYALRMGGANRTTLERFSAFCPKAFFGIGDFLPDTLADRSIPIRLKRRMSDEPIERFRRRDAEAAGHDLRDRLGDWLEPQLNHLAAARPSLPAELDERAADAWEPLLAIADCAGGNWPERARHASVELSTGDEREDDSLTARLLRDIHSRFGNDTRLATAELLDRLHAIEESPWGDWNAGRGLSPHGLSKLLKPYRIRTMTVRHDGQPVQGYKVEQFADAFARVLGVTGITGVTSEEASLRGSNASNAGNRQDAGNTKNASPVPGDDDYHAHLNHVHAEGWITERERHELRLRHNLIRRFQPPDEAALLADAQVLVDSRAGRWMEPAA